MDDSHVLSGESVSTDASRKGEGDEGKNEVDIVLSGESVSTDASRKDEGDEGKNEVDIDEGVIPSLGKKSAEILIDMDTDRKKVITLDDSKNLEEVFFKAIAEDATFKEYVDSAVIFQIFSHKFNTWVDLDRSKEIIDGTHLKAIFRAKTDRAIGLCHTSEKSGKKRKYSDLSEDERCASTSTQFDGQDEMKRGLPGRLWKEQVSGSNSSPTISQGLLFYQLLITIIVNNIMET
jgi:hypothetical protein